VVPEKGPENGRGGGKPMFSRMYNIGSGPGLFLQSHNLHAVQYS